MSVLTAFVSIDYYKKKGKGLQLKKRRKCRY